MAETREEARARRLEELRQAREEKAAQMAADRLNVRAAAVETLAKEQLGGVKEVQVGATTAERVAALKQIKAAEDLATYSAEESFKKIEWKDLPTDQRYIFEINALTSGATIKDPTTGEIRKPTAAEYYEMRGGVNRAGVYGDSYVAGKSLTERERQLAILQGGPGTGAGAALNLANQKKEYQYLQGQGLSKIQAAIRTGYFGDFVNLQVKEGVGRYSPATGLKSAVFLVDGKYYDETGKEIEKSLGEQYWASAPQDVSTVNLGSSSGNVSFVSTSNTSVSNISTAATVIPSVMTTAQQDVYSIMTARLNQYNLGALAPLIRKLAIEGATEATIMLQLSEEPLYKQRFKANQARIEKGLTVLSPSDYLRMEDTYRQILRAYGLTQFDNDDYVSQFIAKDISATELSNRVVTAVQRVRNADPAVTSMLRNFYGIGQNDLVAYVLDPEQQFQKIERQVAASEIGVAAARQGFNIGATVAEQLAAQGITQAEAQRGYSTIADILPTAEKLSDIYGGAEEEYRLPEAEQEVFNQLASAQRKRQRLIGRETAAFSGTSGLGRTSLTQQTGGQF